MVRSCYLPELALQQYSSILKNEMYEIVSPLKIVSHLKKYIFSQGNPNDPYSSVQFEFHYNSTCTILECMKRIKGDENAEFVLNLPGNELTRGFVDYLQNPPD